MYVWADCPKCDGQIQVAIKVYPGEDPVYYPNDRAHPGAPPDIEIQGEGDRSGCECELTSADWDELYHNNLERFWEEASDALLEAEEFYQDMKMHEMMEERYMREEYE